MTTNYAAASAFAQSAFDPPRTVSRWIDQYHFQVTDSPQVLTLMKFDDGWRVITQVKA